MILPMDTVYLGAAVILLLNVLAGLGRVLRGPTAADRMLAAQLFGTTVVAMLLLLGAAAERDALRDVAMVFAVLAPIAGVAFVRRAWAASREEVERA